MSKTTYKFARRHDLTSCLSFAQYGQCFIRVSGPTEVAGRSRAGWRDLAPRVITGRVLFGKNPCMHPGDIRVLEAVDVPHLRHKVNELVLPTKGPRSHASEASGSDFDGYLYLTIWDPDLVPLESAAPMDYKAPTGRVDDVGPEVRNNHRNRQLQVSMNDRAPILIVLVLVCAVDTTAMRTKLARRECYTTLTTLFINLLFFSFQNSL